MGEFPTEKQERVAKAISRVLKRKLPSMKTKEAYTEFIKANINAFKRERQKYVTDYNDFSFMWE